MIIIINYLIQYLCCQKWLFFVYALLFPWTLIIIHLHLFSECVNRACTFSWLVHQPGKMTKIVQGIIMYLNSLFECFFIFLHIYHRKNVILVHLEIESYISSIIYRHTINPAVALQWSPSIPDTLGTNINVLIT